MNLNRAAMIECLESRHETDVLILGGGINGAGLFRELAENGIDCLLVDRQDFAFGATSASSRMIHGGLRYLENGEFRLVGESLRERDLLLRNAPHAVKPLATTIPIYCWWSGLFNAAGKFIGRTGKPSPRGAVLVKIGLTLYDLLSGGNRTLPPHHMTGRKGALRRRPLLDPKIVCTATYFDAWVALPERLCLELIDDGRRAHPHALALNYVEPAGREPDGQVALRDHASGQTFRIKPRVVVNATGAWIDPTNLALGRLTKFVGGTKGSHLVLDHPALLAATDGEQLFYENQDGRICILFPVNGKVLLGSTDIRIESPDEAVCSEEEIDYMLEAARRLFPSLEIRRDHIVSRFCGVRPLPACDESFTGRISRDHCCRELEPSAGCPWPVLSMIGGKWTTFRAFAEQVGTSILARLGRTRRTTTESLPIGGRGEEPDYQSDEELAQILRNEAVVHLDDLLLRRTPLALYGFLTKERFDEILRLAAATLGWTDEVRERERALTLDILKRRHGIAL